jgi:hypothetical protein
MRPGSNLLSWLVFFPKVQHIIMRSIENLLRYPYLNLLEVILHYLPNGFGILMKVIGQRAHCVSIAFIIREFFMFQQLFRYQHGWNISFLFMTGNKSGAVVVLPKLVEVLIHLIIIFGFAFAHFLFKNGSPQGRFEHF